MWEDCQHMGSVRRKAQGSLGRGPAPVIQGVRQWHQRDIVLRMGKRTGCQEACRQTGGGGAWGWAATG